jgi:hypothetical protein
MEHFIELENFKESIYKSFSEYSLSSLRVLSSLKNACQSLVARFWNLGIYDQYLSKYIHLIASLFYNNHLSNRFYVVCGDSTLKMEGINSQGIF